MMGGFMEPWPLGTSVPEAKDKSDGYASSGLRPELKTHSKRSRRDL